MICCIYSKYMQYDVYLFHTSLNTNNLCNTINYSQMTHKWHTDKSKWWKPPGRLQSGGITGHSSTHSCTATTGTVNYCKLHRTSLRFQGFSGFSFMDYQDTKASSCTHDMSPCTAQHAAFPARFGCAALGTTGLLTVHDQPGGSKLASKGLLKGTSSAGFPSFQFCQVQVVTVKVIMNNVSLNLQLLLVIKMWGKRATVRKTPDIDDRLLWFQWRSIQ